MTTERRAAQAFGAVEANRVMALPEAARIEEFYAAWCVAEAKFKLGQQAESCHYVEHVHVAIALCSGRALAEPPSLRIIESLPDFIG